MINAGIVTYNPDITRLRENINSILPQVGKVIIFDNGSDNVQAIVTEFGHVCTIIRSAENVGIASALNKICAICKDNCCDWVLTLDQDSVCPANIISEYTRFISVPGVRMITSRIHDRNFGSIEWNSDNEYDEIDSCITSASLLNLDSWREVGGFWDELFIDMVDYDIGWSIKEKGYKIIRVNSVTLLHELGHSTAVIFRGRKVPVLNHIPERYYYFVRNNIAVGRKHHRKWQCFRWNMKCFYLVLVHEHDRPAKIWKMIYGIIDGLHNKLGKYS